MVMKHYSPEFRVEAVALYRFRPGVTIKSVAAGLGVNHETLRNWIRLDEVQRAGASATTASAPAPVSSEDETAALRRRVRELEEERDILRKAARYFRRGDALVNRSPVR